MVNPLNSLRLIKILTFASIFFGPAFAAQAQEDGAPGEVPQMVSKAQHAAEVMQTLNNDPNVSIELKISRVKALSEFILNVSASCREAHFDFTDCMEENPFMWYFGKCEAHRIHFFVACKEEYEAVGVKFD